MSTLADPADFDDGLGFEDDSPDAPRLRVGLTVAGLALLAVFLSTAASASGTCPLRDTSLVAFTLPAVGTVPT